MKFKTPTAVRARRPASWRFSIYSQRGLNNANRSNRRLEENCLHGLKSSCFHFYVHTRSGKRFVRITFRHTARAVRDRIQNDWSIVCARSFIRKKTKNPYIWRLRGEGVPTSIPRRDLRPYVHRVPVRTRLLSSWTRTVSNHAVKTLTESTYFRYSLRGVFPVCPSLQFPFNLLLLVFLKREFFVTRRKRVSAFVN